MVKRIPQGVDKEQLVIEQEIGSTSDLSISGSQTIHSHCSVLYSIVYVRVCISNRNGHQYAKLCETTV